tara:strand:+ start:1513 stop:2082 length:570 start_codon:yes stop_codon:yes gene_type:complete
LLKNKLFKIKFFLFALILLAILFFLFSIFNSKNDTSYYKGEMEKFVTTNSKYKSENIFWFDSNDKKIRFNNYNGKIVLVNFWASWCAPCIKELPSINMLNNRLEKSQFESVIISIDKNREKSKRMYDSLELNNLNYYYDKKNHLVSYLNIDVIPTTIIYNKNGKEIGRLTGEADWNSSDAIKLIKYLIK